MEDLQQQMVNVYTRWQAVYSALQKLPPTAWQPHLPNTNLEMVNEAVTTLNNYVVQANPPRGFNPTYELGKTVAAMRMSTLMTAVQHLEAGTYAQLPNLVAAIVGVLTAAHTLAIFSDRKRKDKDSLSADLSAKLSQGLALLETAQTELAQKTAVLEKAISAAGSIETALQNVAKVQTDVTKLRADIEVASSKASSELHAATAAVQAEIEKTKNSATAALDSATSSSNKIQLLEPAARELIRDTDLASKRLNEMASATAAVTEKNVTQQALVDSLLPRAASAGLAAAFAVRGKSLEIIKWVWMAAFLTAVALLAYFAHDILTVNINAANYLNYLLTRVTVAAPLVWIGWFSAIQYGNNVRVQEDYAFKEATSKAFQGYRDHMQHLETVSSADAGNAMNLLAIETIKILAREPLRIYDQTHDDAAPMQRAASRWFPWRRGNDVTATDANSTPPKV